MPDFITSGPSIWGDAERSGDTVELDSAELAVSGPDFWRDLAGVVSISSDGIPEGEVDAEYDGFTVTASNGAEPYAYAVTGGVLPDGLTLDEETGEVSGTPTVAGYFPIVITATDDNGKVAELHFSLTIAEAA